MAKHGKSIFRFDNVLPSHVCDKIVTFMKECKGISKIPDLSKFPWNNNDSFNWNEIPDNYLYARIESYREFVTFLVSNCYNETVYPHYTDIVLWRVGNSMKYHRDDGYTDQDVYMRQRAYTTITYLNDDFSGGETIIKSEKTTYINNPKKGSIVICKSNEENIHAVNKITSGIRVTLPIWFTRDSSAQELYYTRN